jgi:Zn-dependent protease
MSETLGEGYDAFRARTITRVAGSERNSHQGIPLGRVLGFPVHLTLSWVVLAVFVTILYGGLVADARPALATGAAYGFGALFVAGLLGSVLLHELGHAVVSRRLGTGVKGITLELLGGYTEMERDAPRPGIEAAVSLAGPAASMTLALVAGAGAAALPGDGTGAHFLAHLAVTNAIIAIFNVLPGLPLDGGRALHAAIWAGTGDPHRGRRVAGASGVALAAGLAAVTVLIYAWGWLSLVGAAFTLVVAGSIGLGGAASVRLGRAGARLRLLAVDRLTRPIFGVPAGTTIAEAHRLAGDEDTVFGVVDPDGRLWAVVPEAEDATVPVHRRGAVEIDTVARLVGAYRSVPAGLTGDEVLRAVEDDPVGDYLVTAGEDVVGILRVADVNRVLEPGGRGPRVLQTRRSGT